MLGRRGLLHPLGPALAAAIVGAAYLIASPDTADMAAHTFRSWLWEQVGFVTWNGRWFAGHHMSGYSLLFPPLAALLDARVVGTVAGVAASALFASLARTATTHAPAAALAGWLFAAGAMSNVVIGRMPFVLGLALAVGAWACARSRGWVGRAGAAALSLACVWASPPAGLFLALAAVGLLLAPRGRERRGVALVLAGPAVAGGLVQAALFPEGGTDRFAATAFWPMLLACLAALALVDPRRRVLLVAGGLYVAMLVAAFALPSPVGQNALRPGALLGLPLLVLAARPRSAPYVAVVGAVLLYLQWLPAVRAVAEARGDPSTQRAYHAEVVSFLRVHSAPGDRVEVPLTRNHWEAAYLARVVPLARGWHRQLDRKVAPLFYDGRRLSAERYTAWLWRSGVRWVALPAVPLDFSARQEAALLRRGLPALHLVHRSARWTIWRVDGSVPVASGPARVSALRLDGFDLVAHGTGTVIVRERFTPYFRLVRGTGCVRRSRAGWTAVRVDRPGRISVTAKFSAAGALRPARRCRSPDQADAS